MENAHLRIGTLKFERTTEKINTSIRVKADRYIGLDTQAHLISVFGNDTDIGAITAAVHETLTFQLTFPDGTSKSISLGEKASCFRGTVLLQDCKRPVRHLVAVSEELRSNGRNGVTFIPDWSRRDLAWATLASLLGVPADVGWGEVVLRVLERADRVKTLDGIGFDPRAIHVASKELLGWIGKEVGRKHLPFPQKNGPIFWPKYQMREILTAAE